MATVALVAAGFWLAVPAAVVAAATPAHTENVPCSCCEGQAALGGAVACPSCQVGVPAGNEMPVRHASVTAAWPGSAAMGADGIDPAPAEPPPR